MGGTSVEAFTQTERLSLYRLLVEQTNVVGAARRETNRFFLTLHTAAFGGIGFVLTGDSSFPPVFVLLVVVGLAPVCLMWLSLLGYYGSVVSAKFEVIHELESKFEIRPFILEQEKVWEKPRRSFGATPLEASIPVVFFLAYIAIGIYTAAKVDWPGLVATLAG